MSDLCFQPAHQLRQQLLDKTLSARELLSAYQQRIAQHNPAINALVKRDVSYWLRLHKDCANLA